MLLLIRGLTVHYSYSRLFFSNQLPTSNFIGTPAYIGCVWKCHGDLCAVVISALLFCYIHIHVPLRHLHVPSSIFITRSLEFNGIDIATALMLCAVFCDPTHVYINSCCLLHQHVISLGISKCVKLSRILGFHQSCDQN